MYQPQPPRALSSAVSLGIVALMGALLVFGLGVRPTIQQASMPLLTVALTDLPKPPPPPPPPRPVQHERAKKSAAKDKPSARNIRNQATQVVAPQVQPIKPPPPVVVAPVAGAGLAANNGASNRVGPGQGAGGVGNGLGGGGNGGDGDDDADWETPPRELSTKLSLSDLPPGFFDNDARGISMEVQFTVLVNGTAANCHTTRSSGYRDIDAQICRKVEQRFRLRPALDADGRPVRSEMVKSLYFGPGGR